MSWEFHPSLLLLFNVFKVGQIYNSANIFTIQYIITNQNRLTKKKKKFYKTNNIYKDKIFYILNIIIKTETLNFYCHYLTIKSLVVNACDTRNMGLKIVQNFSTEARHRIYNCYDIHVATP